MEIALDAGAEDVTTGDDMFEIVTAPDGLEDVRQALENANIGTVSVEATMVPQNTVSLSGKEAEQTLRLLDALQELDSTARVGDRPWHATNRMGCH